MAENAPDGLTRLSKLELQLSNLNCKTLNSTPHVRKLEAAGIYLVPSCLLLRLVLERDAGGMLPTRSGLMPSLQGGAQLDSGRDYSLDPLKEI